MLCAVCKGYIQAVLCSNSSEIAVCSSIYIIHANNPIAGLQQVCDCRCSSQS
uniref:Uncharacterized protein n=1 Tax=Anguilla anguilla TaxID=7936 RepID=A0A0E9XAW7_ANGAN